MIRRSVAIVIFLGLGLGIAQARVDEPPAGLTLVDWAQIRALYEQHRHTATLEDDGSYVARNPRQGWSIRFDGRGFTVRPDEGDWSWGLELVGFGIEGAQQAIDGKAAVRAEHGRVSYGWRPELEEWFVNDQRGLEHGWTVSERPLGDGERLEIGLVVRGGLRPEVEISSGSAVRFLDDSGAAVISYSGLKAWDANGRTLSSSMAVSRDGGLAIMVDDRDARYPLTIDPVAVQVDSISPLVPAGVPAGGGFGQRFALSGDTLVVAVRAEDGGGVGVNPDSQGVPPRTNSGAVYVFQRESGVWTQQAYIKASNPGVSDEFGDRVAISGDTLAVSAISEDSNGVGVNPNSQTDNSASNSGAVYVFQREGSVWTQQAYIKASNTEQSDSFGFSVALSGDTLVVGAINEDSSGEGPNAQDDNSLVTSGAAYVFEREGNVWAQTAYLKASNPETVDQFGYAAAVSGDRLVVTAPLEDSGGVGINPNSQADNSLDSSGAIYVFLKSGSGWEQEAYIKASNTGAGDDFGISVALSGDTLAIGALNEDSNGVGVNPNSQANNSAANSGWTCPQN